MNNSRERLVHVLGWSKLGHVVKSTTNLITHGARDVVAGDLVLVVDQRLGPDLGIDFILSVQVVTDIILLLCNLVKSLLPMNIHSRDGLSQVGPTLVLLELSVSHIIYTRYFIIN